MTTFEQPDAGVLVEYLLPSLLGACHSLSQEVQERTLFFGELGTALEQLHGRLTVISSPPSGPREPSQYPWLWRYVSHFTVGANTRAVQHAKLWAFHWKVGSGEQLDLYISSTNLTASAFKAQLQAGWQTSVRLGERATLRARHTWGELVPFLEALAKSAGDAAVKRVQRLVALLHRAECPEGIRFIASIPGQKCAALQLRKYEATELHVLTPTIGEWNQQTIADWSKDVGVPLDKLRLKWIATSHPWADPSKWTLPQGAYQTFVSKEVKVECLPHDARFTAEHRVGDDRWSHAKLYLLRKGKQRWLVVTSANWSPSAWGAGGRLPRNFELGVAFRSDWTDLESIAGMFVPGTTPYLTEPERKPTESKLQWAEASWDGKRIALCARSTDTVAPISTVVTFTGNAERRIVLSKGEASMPWNDAERTPLTARCAQGSEALEVNVLDIRDPSEFAKTPLPEVEPALADALREAFLLHRYGGSVVEADSIPGLGDLRRVPGGTPLADYSVQAWLDARSAFGVVDSWRAALDEATAEPMMLERVRLDGVALRAIYARREGPAAAVVAEELQWRLAEEP